MFVVGNVDPERSLMKTYKYVINGNPIPLARPRFGKNNVYDSQKSEKEGVAWYVRFLRKDEHILKGPLQMEIRFFLKKPMKKMKKIWHDTKPDLSNLIKFYEDVCIGILYEDDKQISKIIASKVYDDEPRTEIILTVLGESDYAL